MMTFLTQILDHKKQEVLERKARVSLQQMREIALMAPQPLDFVGLLRKDAHHYQRPALIAEIKYRSPSKGILAHCVDPLQLANTYAANGAAAISVLTDQRYFGGQLEHLRQVADMQPWLPLLCKDFICDPYQVYEARAAGADAVLLIVAGLEQQTLEELHDLVIELGMAPLVEVHTGSELQRAIALEPLLVGINNRNLMTFDVSLDTCLRLRDQSPPGVLVVAESGIHTAQDVASLADAGFGAILVGEALITAGDIGAKVRELTQRFMINIAPNPLSPAGRIKICGITNFEDALLAVEAGADMLGFNFYPHSPRFISPEVCQAIVHELRTRGAHPQMVGIFVNMPVEQIRGLMRTCDLDLAQLSGDENLEEVKVLKGRAYKSLRIDKKDGALRIASQYAGKETQPALLLDANVTDAYGGTGNVADWQTARLLAVHYPILLAGGLTPDNVADAIRTVKPWGVDVASGVESFPGKKDPDRLRKFITQAKDNYRQFHHDPLQKVLSGGSF
jgi:indole-3-glycerol phosphate synthase / phosphoribosylanthranilate isomerase